MSKSGKRVPNNATFLQRAELHSEQQGDCWKWLGYTTNGSPTVARSKQQPVNLRTALLTELGVERPEGAHTATVTCGNRDCVNPKHIRWETPKEYSLRCRSRQPTKITLDQIAEAWERRQKGEVVAQIARDYAISRQGLYRQWEQWGYK